MRPSRGPYARRNSGYRWFTSTAWLLIALMLLLIPAGFLWPGILPGAVMWVMGADVVFIGVWTLSAASRRILQTHQVIANLGIMAGLVLFIISYAVKAPFWVTGVLTVIVVCLAALGIYRHPD